MIRPLAAVVSCSKSIDGRRCQSVSDRFLHPIGIISELTPLIVPSLPTLSDARSLARTFDALMLTGANSNVAPTRYGDARPHRGEADAGRDHVALALAAEMIALGKPVYGICRGLQEIDVLFGGTLRDDLNEAHSGIKDGKDYAASLGSNTHPVLLDDGIFGAARTIDVSSTHEQGIDRLGRGLRVEATAPDGLIEAVSSDDWTSVVAVQWHPELRAETDPDSRAFYRMFGDAARGIRPDRKRTA